MVTANGLPLFRPGLEQTALDWNRLWFTAGR